MVKLRNKPGIARLPSGTFQHPSEEPIRRLALPAHKKGADSLETTLFTNNKHMKNLTTIIV